MSLSCRHRLTPVVAVLRVLAGLHHVEDVIASFVLAHVVVFSAGVQEPFCQVEGDAPRLT